MGYIEKSLNADEIMYENIDSRFALAFAIV